MKKDICWCTYRESMFDLRNSLLSHMSATGMELSELSSLTGVKFSSLSRFLGSKGGISYGTFLKLSAFLYEEELKDRVKNAPSNKFNALTYKDGVEDLRDALQAYVLEFGVSYRELSDICDLHVVTVEAFLVDGTNIMFKTFCKLYDGLELIK